LLARLLDKSQYGSEGPATGRTDTGGFVWFSAVSKQVLTWFSRSKLPLLTPHAGLLI